MGAKTRYFEDNFHGKVQLYAVKNISKKDKVSEHFHGLKELTGHEFILRILDVDARHEGGASRRNGYILRKFIPLVDKT